jgi:hypothetical protein
VQELLTPRLPIRVAFEAFDIGKRSLRLSVLNRGYTPAVLRALVCTGNRGAAALAVRIEGRSTGRPAVPQTVEIERVGAVLAACLEREVRSADHQIFDGLELRYALPGGAQPRVTTVESTRWAPPLTADPALKANADALAALVARGVVRVDSAAGEIHIQPGDWRIARDAVFPAGARVVAGRGRHSISPTARP